MPISFADADRIEDYWAFRRDAGLLHTGELSTEISAQRKSPASALLRGA